MYTCASQVALVVKKRGLDPWVGKILGGGHGNPLQYSCLENPMDKGAWKATPWGSTVSDTTGRTQHSCTYELTCLNDSTEAADRKVSGKLSACLPRLTQNTHQPAPSSSSKPSAKAAALSMPQEGFQHTLDSSSSPSGSRIPTKIKVSACPRRNPGPCCSHNSGYSQQLRDTQKYLNVSKT